MVEVKRSELLSSRMVTLTVVVTAIDPKLAISAPPVAVPPNSMDESWASIARRPPTEIVPVVWETAPMESRVNEPVRVTLPNSVAAVLVSMAFEPVKMIVSP